MRSFRAALIALMALAATAQAKAQSVADFYRGKTVTLLVGVSAGGEYDFLARLAARYMGKHIPGNPTVVVQNMVGAGGISEANYLYNVAPKDGTYIGMIQNALPTMQAVGVPGPQFDSSKFNWIGSIAPTVETLAVWHTSGVTTIDQAREKEIIIGAVGRGGITYTFPLMMNEFAGTKFKIVVGYPGGNDVNLAMEKGEVGGRGSNSWASWKSGHPQWITEHKIYILVQVALERSADLPDVPLMMDLAKNDEDKQVLRFLSADMGISRAFATTPGVPADRLAALRSAFEQTMKDPEFLAEATKSGMDIAPSSGDVAEKIAASMLATPPNVVKRAKEIMESGGKK